MDDLSARPDTWLRYGTGGFRGPALEVQHAFARCGVVAALRSQSLGGSAVGVMITASHNPEEDNGVKITERDGRMLDREWEQLAEEVVNADNIAKAIEKVRLEHDLGGEQARCCVLVGRDTRRSSRRFSELVISGVDVIRGSSVINTGEVSTPELHWAVMQKNADQPDFRSYRAVTASRVQRVPPPLPGLAVDCANGVGAKVLSDILRRAGLSSSVTLFNCGEGALNHRCGADYVQKALCAPDRRPCTDRGASLDGDADRLVYYRLRGESDAFDVVDGDKILAFVLDYLVRTLPPNTYSLGAVHTAYTNGACVEHLSRLDQVQRVCAGTGVKHLEREARKFDIGAYWEPNGHGTVLFRDDEIVRSLPPAVRQVLVLANQAVGDAIGNLFLLEAILAQSERGLDALTSVFVQYPSCNRVLSVRDKSVLKTVSTDEQRLEAPRELQTALDRLVAESPSSTRAFVRPSGTEDVVRIYVESPQSLDSAKELADRIALLVRHFCG